MFLQIFEEMLTLIGGLVVAFFVYVLMTKKHDNNSSSSAATDTPNMATTALREFVEHAVEEVRKLPALGSPAANEKQDLSTSDRTYEDLLATAILNKVIEKYQKENVLPGFKNKYDDSSEGLDEVDNGSSSLEPLSQDECNSEWGTYPSKCMQNYPEPLSLMIEERIEEVTTYASDEEVQHNEDNGLAFRRTKRVPFPELGMDIVDPSQESSDSDVENENKNHVNVVSQVESWEENWLFQKKKMQTRSEPVAMLVPNPSADFRALIGDKDAEDTSDLSECFAQSDDEIEQELEDAIESVIPKHESTFDDETTAAFNGHEEAEVSTNAAAVTIKSDKLNGTALQNGDKKIKENDKANLRNRSKVSTNPFAIGEKKDSKLNDDEDKDSRSNPFKNGNLRGEMKVETETQMFRDMMSPRTPMPTPVNEDGQKFLGCDVNVLCKKLDNVKNPFVFHLNSESETEKSLDVNHKNNLPSEDEAQRERECTEHYDIAIQRHVDSLRRPRSSLSQDNEKKENTTRNAELQSSTDSTANSTTNEPLDKKSRETSTFAEAESSHRFPQMEKVNPDVELSTPPRPGTIAEREHKKWENAAPIQNNPYSQENIRKRLLEKQYAKRPTELTGNNNDLPQTTESSTIFNRNTVDIKRFGRDYYINEMKSGNEGSLVGGRPTSSMSQRSNSSGSETERQESIKYDNASFLEDDIPALMQNHVNASQEENTETKLWAMGQNNYHNVYNSKDQKPQINGQINGKVKIPEILIEKINGSSDVNSSPIKEQSKKIQRLNLKAYDFDHKLNGGGISRSSPQRVVNKLDLSLFGFDGGLKKAQSTYQLNSHESYADTKMSRSESTKVLSKYNKDSEISKRISMFDRNRGSNDQIKNNFNGLYYLNGMKSAKSVPNISRIDQYNSSTKFSKYDKGDVSKFILAEKNRQQNWSGSCETLDSKLYSSSDDVSIEELLMKFEKNDDKTPSEGSSSSSCFTDKELPMPSVKRLAETFNKTPNDISTSNSKITKVVTKSNHTRTKTPEIQIIEKPKQMHSLTARSLSKEFREGLRQIPSKVTSCPALQIKHEKQIAEHEVFINRDERETDVISPGKLRDNIQFWEKLQKQS